ncbi:MAG TPA: NIL domain-containing protein [bacterium]|nr:NIL domain-containing protein [bacterium]
MLSIKKLVELDYPTEKVTQPVLSAIIKKYDVTVNIRRASITKGFGYVQMEIEGPEAEVKKALDDLTAQGIDVNPIVKDIVE